jgi:hypothetical protein
MAQGLGLGAPSPLGAGASVLEPRMRKRKPSNWKGSVGGAYKAMLRRRAAKKVAHKSRMRNKELGR